MQSLPCRSPAINASGKLRITFCHRDLGCTERRLVGHEAVLDSVHQCILSLNLGISPVHGLFGCAGEGGGLECFDLRQRSSIGFLDAAAACGAPGECGYNMRMGCCSVVVSSRMSLEECERAQNKWRLGVGRRVRY